MASIISPDLPWLRALEGACQARLGRARNARAILAGLEALRRLEYVDAYHMAVLHVALGQPTEAMAELDRAFVENSTWLYASGVDPSWTRCATTADFAASRSGTARRERVVECYGRHSKLLASSEFP